MAAHCLENDTATALFSAPSSSTTRSLLLLLFGRALVCETASGVSLFTGAHLSITPSACAACVPTRLGVGETIFICESSLFVLRRELSRCAACFAGSPPRAAFIACSTFSGEFVSSGLTPPEDNGYPLSARFSCDCAACTPACRAIVSRDTTRLACLSQA